MRTLKFTAVAVLSLALLASAALAGGAGCQASKAQAAGAGCTAKQAASCMSGGAEHCSIEATRLPSGGLVVHYAGKNAEAVSYLHAKAEGSADKFCCAMTSKMASNENCKVDIVKVSNGVLVYVTSTKQEVVDAYEKEFAALTAAAPATK